MYLGGSLVVAATITGDVSFQGRKKVLMGHTAEPVACRTSDRGIGFASDGRRLLEPRNESNRSVDVSRTNEAQRSRH